MGSEQCPIWVNRGVHPTVLPDRRSLLALVLRGLSQGIVMGDVVLFAFDQLRFLGGLDMDEQVVPRESPG